VATHGKSRAMCNTVTAPCACLSSLAEMVCFFMNATMHMVSECMNNVSVRISYICTLVLMPVYV
jgi:hypothetical protein